MATECGLQMDGDVMIAGASNAASTEEHHTFVFAGNPNDPDSEGVYFEIDDQLYSGYNHVEAVEFRQNGLRIILNDELAKEYREKEIVVLISNTEGLLRLKAGIRDICRGSYEIIESDESIP